MSALSAQKGYPVVFDCGSCSTKVGLSSEHTPLIFPTLASQLDNEIFVGHEAKQKGCPKSVLQILVNNWDYMEKIWAHGFELLKVDPTNHAVLLSRNFLTKYELEKTAQIFFEKFNIPALHINFSPVLSLHSEGFLSGLVIDSGFFETQFYPIYEGHILQRAFRRGLPVAGQYLTEFVCNSIEKRGLKCDYNTAEKIKIKSLYISPDVNKEKAQSEVFTLPDGNTVTLNTERYLIPEELYASSIECSGVHEYIFPLLYHCDPEIRKSLYENIMLSGGTTLMLGFKQRLEKELIKIQPEYKFLSSFTPKIVTTNDPISSAWIGGSLLSSLSTFPAMCMSNEEYNESGPELTCTKFF